MTKFDFFSPKVLYLFFINRKKALSNHQFNTTSITIIKWFKWVLNLLSFASNWRHQYWCKQYLYRHFKYFFLFQTNVSQLFSGSPEWSIRSYRWVYHYTVIECNMLVVQVKRHSRSKTTLNEWRVWIFLATANNVSDYLLFC